MQNQPNIHNTSEEGFTQCAWTNYIYSEQFHHYRHFCTVMEDCDHLSIIKESWFRIAVKQLHTSLVTLAFCLLWWNVPYSRSLISIARPRILSLTIKVFIMLTIAVKLPLVKIVNDILWAMESPKGNCSYGY